jgi:hypothetical protein
VLSDQASGGEPRLVDAGQTVGHAGDCRPGRLTGRLITARLSRWYHRSVIPVVITARARVVIGWLQRGR